MDVAYSGTNFAEKNYRPSRKLLICAAIFAIITTILAAAAIIIAFCLRPDANYAYSIMVDAGSTSSKVTVFRWRDLPFLTNRWVHEVNTTRSKKGVSEYSNDTRKASSSIYSLVSKALNDHVPPSMHDVTYFYLGATAGMRLLNYQDPMKAEQILEELRKSSSDIGLRVHNPYSDIRIISGKSEGQNAWVSCNYLSKKLGDEGGAPADTESEMIGSLDLGGASTQISFVPTKKSSKQHTSTIQLFSKKYNLYSYSFLCYGIEAIKLRYFATLISKSLDLTNVSIPSPCHLKGYSFEVKKARLLEHACLEPQLSNYVYGREISLPVDMPHLIKLHGAGDPNTCQHIIGTFFNMNVCQHDSCSFNNVYQPPVRGKFYAFSSFMHVMKFLSHDAGGVNNTRNEINQAASEYCRKNWSNVVSTINPNHLKYVADYCFGGFYMEKLLEGYGFVESDSWKNIQFVEKVDGTIVSWALGHVIDSTGTLRSNAPTSYLNEVGFAVGLTSLFFFTLLLIAALLFIMCNYKCVRTSAASNTILLSTSNIEQAFRNCQL